MMNIVLFLSGQNVDSARRLHRVAAATVPPSILETIYCYDRLELRLRNVPQNIAVVVLFAIDTIQLARLVELKPLLENVLTIVVLPDRHAETVAMGHQLRPRLLTDSNDNFSDVAAVLSKLLERCTIEMSS